MSAEEQASAREAERETFTTQIMQKVKDEFNKEARESTLKILLDQRDEAMTNKPKTKWSEKLSEKSYKRIDKFAGGENAWQDWRYDSELLTGALNPQVAEELKATAEAIAPRTFAVIREGFVLQPQDN